MTIEQIAEHVAAVRAVAEAAEPEFMTVPEMVAWLRLDALGVKNPERWIKDRLMPSHSEYLPHTCFTRNQPLFDREQRAWIRERYRKPMPATAAASADAQVLEFDPALIKRGARARGITA